jgi:plastocyanin
VLGAVLLGHGSLVIAGDLRAHVEGDHEAVANAAITASPLDVAALPPSTPPANGSIDQIDKQFVPQVIVVQTGAAVTFPNRDQIRHQVYSFSSARRFEIPLYAGTPAEAVVFDKPGIVALGCNIHDWMAGYIYVTDTRWFATTDTDGFATIRDLPAGRWRIQVWHPRLVGPEAGTAREVEIPQTGGVDVEWELALKPARRPWRAPLPGASGYR